MICVHYLPINTWLLYTVISLLSVSESIATLLKTKFEVYTLHHTGQPNHIACSSNAANDKVLLLYYNKSAHDCDLK